MLSNRTIKEIQERLDYSNKHLATVTNPTMKKMLLKDLKESEDQMTEAKSRIIVGYDVEDNSRVYVCPSNYCGGVLCLNVEGKPSGWNVAKFDIRINNTIEVVYDGRTKWIGKLKFTSTFESVNNEN